MIETPAAKPGRLGGLYKLAYWRRRRKALLAELVDFHNAGVEAPAAVVDAFYQVAGVVVELERRSSVN